MNFRFKQFAVNHSKSSMKTGTDAVLLGIWAETNEAENILDVGTGCGVISLIAAQKTLNSKITAIDIDKNSVEEALENFEKSIWSHRLIALNISFQDFLIHQNISFDHILCNPPFFNKSTPSSIESRHLARHSDKLNSKDFFECCSKTLNPKGKISIIIPSSDFDSWNIYAEYFNFYVNKKTNVFSYKGNKSERTLIEFSSEKTQVCNYEIYIRDGKNQNYTEQYIELTKDFYLDLNNTFKKHNLP